MQSNSSGELLMLESGGWLEEYAFPFRVSTLQDAN
jgi:hypothetical protein